MLKTHQPRRCTSCELGCASKARSRASSVPCSADAEAVSAMARHCNEAQAESWDGVFLSRKTIGKPWENHGKPWENHGKMVVKWFLNGISWRFYGGEMGFDGIYPSVMTNITVV